MPDDGSLHCDDEDDITLYTNGKSVGLTSRCATWCSPLRPRAWTWTNSSAVSCPLTTGPDAGASGRGSRGDRQRDDGFFGRGDRRLSR